MQCTPPVSKRLVHLNWRKLVHDNRPMAYCYVCFGSSVASKVIVFLLYGHSGFFHKIKTDSDHYSGVTLSVQRTIRKLTLSLTVFISILTIRWSRSVWYPAVANSPTDLWLAGVEPF